MKFQITIENIKEISDILGVKPVESAGAWTWNLSNKQTGQKLIISLYNDVDFTGGSKGVMISVQSMHGYFELHDISAFMIFEPDEVIFIRSDDRYLSSLVVGRESTCSLYSNISRDMLKTDLSDLDPSVLLSAMQLSITDVMLAGK